MLLAALTLLTGMLGHVWAHHGGDAPAAAWLAALQAERDWLAGATDGDPAAVELFGAERRHSHGEGPAHQHEGPDELPADHAHGVAFLPPPASRLPHRDLRASLAWTLSARLDGAPSGHPDRPPRNHAAHA
jgi:hypothetical protein